MNSPIKPNVFLSHILIVLFTFHIFYVLQHAPGIPKVLVGNRLHLAFKRQVDQAEAETYAERNAMGFFEVSPLVNFNISETFVELARMALKRNGMERLWRSNKGKINPTYKVIFRGKIFLKFLHL